MSRGKDESNCWSFPPHFWLKGLRTYTNNAKVKVKLDIHQVTKHLRDIYDHTKNTLCINNFQKENMKIKNVSKRYLKI